LLIGKQIGSSYSHGLIITLQCYDEYLEKKSLAAPLAHLLGVPKVTGGKKLRF
jgi:hypothetical protein